MCTKLFSIARLSVVISVLMVGTYKPLSADMVAGVSLGAQTIVDAFNGANGGQGLHFYYTTDATEQNIRFLHDYPWANNPGMSTYRGDSYISLQVGETVGGPIRNWPSRPSEGVLSYDNGTSMTTQGSVLNVGAAYLYRMLVTTDDFMADSGAFAAAIRFLFGHDELSTDWNNQYLQTLLSVNGAQDYWQSAYDPDAYYEEIGNYSIFVINSVWSQVIPTDGFSDTPGGVFWKYEDFLYIAGAVNPYEPATTPEPATMLMVGLGLAGLPFVRRLRKK